MFCSLISLLTSCQGAKEKDPFGDVPEFEVRQISFVSGKKKLSPDAEYLMRWNILGPVEHTIRNVEEPAIEEEAILCGRMEAPGSALWHVRIYKSDPAKDRIAGFCNWTNSLKKYTGKKKMLFYGCSTFSAKEEGQKIDLHIFSAGSILLYWNGVKVGVLKKNNISSGKEWIIRDLVLRKGANRLVLKYLDGEKGAALRGVALRVTLQQKDPAERKIALIR